MLRLASSPAAARLPRGDRSRGSRHYAHRGSAVPRLLARPGAREAEPRGERDRAPVRERRSTSAYARKNGKKSSDRGAPLRVTAQVARARDRRPDLLPRASSALPRTRQPADSRAAALSDEVTSFDWVSGKSGTFEFTLPGTHRRYYAVANPIVTGNPASTPPFGAIVVATKKTDVSARVYDLIERLTLAGILGLARRRAPRRLPVAPDRAAGACSSRTRPTRSRAATTTSRFRRTRPASSAT